MSDHYDLYEQLAMLAASVDCVLNKVPEGMRSTDEDVKRLEWRLRESKEAIRDYNPKDDE